MPTKGVPNEQLVAYHKARAEGGAGLIIMQVAGVHETARYTSHLIMATTDDCIPGYRGSGGRLQTLWHQDLQPAVPSRPRNHGKRRWHGARGLCALGGAE